MIYFIYYQECYQFIILLPIFLYTCSLDKVKDVQGVTKSRH